MLDTFNIAIDYAKTISQADKLSRLAGDCSDIRSDLIKQASEVEDKWKGEAGSVLADRLRALAEKNKSVSKRLSSVARNMKNAAEAIREADNEAIEGIKSLRT